MRRFDSSAGDSMGNLVNNSSSNLRPIGGGARRHAIWERPEQLPRSVFVAEVLARRLPHVARDDFQGATAPDALARCGVPLLIRCDRNEEEVEAYLQLPSGALALVDTGYGHVSVEVAASTWAVAKSGAEQLRRELHVDEPDEERISVAFWMRGDCGGEVRHREIEAEPFDLIAGNYPADVGAALKRLFATNAPDSGRLILWRGEPGTGKSHALRALARAWAPWCSAHFIMDPDELLGRGGSYMLDVLTWDGGDGEAQWRLLILEDAGELIAADARSVAGQALSRLLNVADGLLGQGTRTLILITTNEPVGRLHPAARRPGRCLADIEFTAFPVVEANAWLGARGSADRVQRPTALADLYVHTSGSPVMVREAAGSAGEYRIGFAQALSSSSPSDKR